MPKELADMSLEELWALFPIYLVDPKKSWLEDYATEKETLLQILPQNTIASINHIGSTAIKNIQAKDIIDILIETNTKKGLYSIATILVSNGYIKMSEDNLRVSLNKGYTKNGFAEKVYHIHLRLLGDRDEIYFRDYLNTHQNVADAYEQLKLDLSTTFKHNRNAYTEAKSDFIKKWTAIAKKEMS